MEDKLFEAISKLIHKLFIKKALSPVSRQVGSVFDNASEGYMSRKVLDIVKSSVSDASWAGLTDAIPGVGTTINVGALAAITWKMYYDINDALGISFSENILKSVASGIGSNLAAYGVNTALSYVPIIGNIMSAVGGIITNRTALYSSALVYVNFLSLMADSGDYSEENLRRIMNNELQSTNTSNISAGGSYTVRSNGNGKSNRNRLIKGTVKNWHELNVVQNSEKGMTVHSEINMDHVRDREFVLDVSFYNAENEHEIASFKKYLTSEYESAVWSDSKIFAPYSAIDAPTSFYYVAYIVQEEPYEVILCGERSGVISWK